MARDYYIQGEGLVTVKGASDSPIANLSQLGLPAGPIVYTPDFRHRDISPDAWGNEIPNDVQWMLGSVAVSMNLIHFDKTILDYCLQLSMGQPQGTGLLPGQVGRAGQRLGGGNARFAAGWKFISVTITGPVSGIPWRFLNCYMTGPPISWPLGTEKSVVQVNWRALPYAVDPYGGGTGAQGVYLWDNVADS